VRLLLVPLALLTSFALAPANEKDALAAVVAAGGKADTDPKLHPEARVVAKFEAATDATLLALKKLPQVGAVEVFDATRCTEKGFAALKELPHLRRLALGKSAMTAPRTAAIGQLKELRDLRLPESGLSDAELAALKGLTLLEQLDLSDNPQITDKGMVTVKQLSRLRLLSLPKTSIGDKGLMELKELDGLRSLHVGSTKVTADAAEKFADEMPNLRVVRR
jgi:hypothetical protein